MPYTSIQFIGYSIDTAPDDSGPKTTYLGLPNAQADILARCALIERAITTARDNLVQSPPPPPAGTVLKVFMAPEFYLRGDQGAYEMDEVQTAIATLQGLVADDQWSDWLFVFGTILGVADPLHPPLSQEIYNFALIQQGGVANSGSKGARVVMKELKSPIDFIAEYPYGGGLLLGQVTPLAPGAPPGPGRAQQQVTYDGNGIFELPGVAITFAMDICLDHLEYRLVQSPQLPGDGVVQVQLVPSCGADIDPSGVVAGPGGYVFNVDGHNGSHAVLRQVGRKRAIDPQQIVTVPGDAITVTGVSPPETATIAELYRDGPGEVVIFPASAVPAPQVVPGTVAPIATWAPPGGYEFDFELVFDAAGTFVAALCVISGGKVNFGDRSYFLPLDLHTRDSDGQEVHIEMQLIGGGTYDNAIWCRIDLPGFDFEGAALQFDSKPRSPPQPLLTIW